MRDKRTSIQMCVATKDDCQNDRLPLASFTSFNKLMAQSVNEDAWIIESVTNSLEQYITTDYTTTSYKPTLGICIRNGNDDWIIHIFIFFRCFDVDCGRVSVKLQPTHTHKSVRQRFNLWHTEVLWQTESFRCVINHMGLVSSTYGLFTLYRLLSILSFHVFSCQWSCAHVWISTHLSVDIHRIRMINT